MRYVICCMRDVRADTFGTPFFMSSVGQAERQFADEVNRPAEDNIIYKHPEDFELYHLGFFNAQSGSFEILQEKVQLCEGRSLVNPDNVRKMQKFN